MENNNKKEKRTFKELWHDRQMHAVIVLGMWFAFFALAFLFLGIASIFTNPQKNNKTTEVEENKQVSANIPKMLENLINSDYNFEITITEAETKYSYTGTKENNQVVGYYESSIGILKYTIEEDKYYQLNGDEKSENENLISEEDKNNIDLNVLLGKITTYELDNEVIQDKNVYNYVTDELNISIVTNNNTIEKIILKNDNKNYEMTFKNINE